MAAGADRVECDVRRTADGALVLMHDDDVSRTTAGSGRVSAMTLAEVRRLDASARFSDASFAGERVPTPDEAWEETDGRVIFEVKGTSWDPVDARVTALALVRFLSGRDCSEAVISCFDPAVLAVVTREAPEITTGLLGAAGFEPASVIEAAVAGSNAFCFLPDAVISASVISSAHASGLVVVPWTVNDPVRLRELAGWGADGVITDDPGLARRALG